MQARLARLKETALDIAAWSFVALLVLIVAAAALAAAYALFYVCLWRFMDGGWFVLFLMAGGLAFAACLAKVGEWTAKRLLRRPCQPAR